MLDGLRLGSFWVLEILPRKTDRPEELSIDLQPLIVLDNDQTVPKRLIGQSSKIFKSLILGFLGAF